MAPVHYHEGRFLPGERVEWRELVPLIGPVSAAVSRHDGMLSALENRPLAGRRCAEVVDLDSACAIPVGRRALWPSSAIA